MQTGANEIQVESGLRNCADLSIVRLISTNSQAAGPVCMLEPRNRATQSGTPIPRSRKNGKSAERVITVRGRPELVHSNSADSPEVLDNGAYYMEVRVGSSRRHCSLPCQSDESGHNSNSRKLSKGSRSRNSYSSSVEESELTILRNRECSPIRKTTTTTTTTSSDYKQRQRSHPPHELSVQLHTSIGERLSNQCGSSGSGTEDEGPQVTSRTVNSENNPLDQERINRLVKLLETEEKHANALKVIHGTVCPINSRPKWQTPQSKRAQEVVEKLVQLQEDFVHRLKERLKPPIDTKVSVGDIFQCMPNRQEELLKYQVLIQPLIEHCEVLQSKGLPCYSDTTGTMSSKKTSSKTQTVDDAKYWMRHSLEAPSPWISQTIENIKLLIALTPPTNPDHHELRQLFHRLTYSLRSSPAVCIIGEDLLEKDARQLKVHSLIVELDSLTSDDRKLRYLLLFSDVLVCAKIRILKKDRNRIYFGESVGKFRTSDRISMFMKPNQPGTNLDGTSRGLSTSDEHQQIRLETKWIIPLDQLTLGGNTRIASDQQSIAEQEEKMREMKDKVRKIRHDLKKSENKRGATLRSGRFIPHLNKLEGELALQTPQLVLPVGDGQGQMHYILLVTERERDQWRTAIETEKSQYLLFASQQDKRVDRAANPAQSDSTVDALNRTRTQSPVMRPEPSHTEMNELLKHYSQRDLQLVRLNKTGIALLKKGQGITGILEVTVHNIKGLDEVDSYHIRIEVDSYGQYEEVARTRVVTQHANPEWNQSFDLCVDDAHQICFTVYRHCDYFGSFELYLEREHLTHSQEVVAIETNESDSRMIYLTFSLALKQKTPLKTKNAAPPKEGVFRRPLKCLVEYDHKIRSAQKLTSKVDAIEKVAGGNARELHVPRIVTACVDEIERRGLREVGVYRICGSNSEIQTLSTLFNQDQEEAIKRLSTIDVSVITSLLKLFFRELPEPLLTDEGSVALMRAIEIPDERKRLKAIYNSLAGLPPVNGETFKYLVTHLITVARYKETNMMDLGNLALIWSAALFQTASDTLRRYTNAPGGSSSSSNTGPGPSAHAALGASLTKEAAVGFHQTKTLAIILTAVQNGTLTLPVYDSDGN